VFARVGGAVTSMNPWARSLNRSRWSGGGLLRVWLVIFFDGGTDDLFGAFADFCRQVFCDAIASRGGVRENDVVLTLGMAWCGD